MCIPIGWAELAGQIPLILLKQFLELSLSLLLKASQLQGLVLYSRKMNHILLNWSRMTTVPHSKPSKHRPIPVGRNHHNRSHSGFIERIHALREPLNHVILSNPIGLHQKKKLTGVKNARSVRKLTDGHRQPIGSKIVTGKKVLALATSLAKEGTAMWLT